MSTFISTGNFWPNFPFKNQFDDTRETTNRPELQVCTSSGSELDVFTSTGSELQVFTSLGPALYVFLTTGPELDVFASTAERLLSMAVNKSVARGRAFASKVKHLLSTSLTSSRKNSGTWGVSLSWQSFRMYVSWWLYLLKKIFKIYSGAKVCTKNKK